MTMSGVTGLQVFAEKCRTSRFCLQVFFFWTIESVGRRFFCIFCDSILKMKDIPLKTNIAPEKWWMEDEFSLWNGPFSEDMLILGE